MPNNTVRILIADDHPVVRMGIHNMLQQEPGFQVAGEAGDGLETIRQVRALGPDILLLDLAMPKLSGMNALKDLSASPLETRTVVLTSNIDREQVLEALKLGARGIITKRALLSELHECIRTVVSGKFWVLGTAVTNVAKLLQELAVELATPPKKTFGLTPRELTITALVAEGCTNKDAAAECGISEETVKHHLKRVFDKTGVSNRLELAVFAMNHALARSS